MRAGFIRRENERDAAEPLEAEFRHMPRGPDSSGHPIRPCVQLARSSLDLCPGEIAPSSPAMFLPETSDQPSEPSRFRVHGRGGPIAIMTHNTNVRQ